MLGCLLLVTTSFTGTSEEMRRFDHNQDGKPNQWEYYRNGVLLRVEVDRHHDGRVDEWTFYENGKTVWAEFDTTGNGQVNQWLFYNADDQVIRAEYDQQAEGRPDQWEYFTPGSKEPYKVERDTTGDGKADAVWEHGASTSGKPR
jgi:antitoxin component YwqK of YwqJK toxin-antitoxin module